MDQWEDRHGEYVKGGYSMLDADGKIRTVNYEVDGRRGFHAVVKRKFPGNLLIYVINNHFMLQTTIHLKCSLSIQSSIKII